MRRVDTENGRRLTIVVAESLVGVAALIARSSFLSAIASPTGQAA
jgi:hypothetical protein